MTKLFVIKQGTNGYFAAAARVRIPASRSWSTKDFLFYPKLFIVRQNVTLQFHWKVTRNVMEEVGALERLYNFPPESVLKCQNRPQLTPDKMTKSSRANHKVLCQKIPQYVTMSAQHSSYFLEQCCPALGWLWFDSSFIREHYSFILRV